MKNLKHLITVLFLSIGLFANAQNEASFALEGGNSFLSIKQKYDGKIKGSLFINDTFRPAKINDVIQQYPTRYNAYSDNFEVQHNGKVKYIVITKENETQVKFSGNNKLYKTFTYTDRDKTKKGFFVVLSEGKKHSFVLKEKIVFVDEQKPKTPYEKYKNPELKRKKDVYYLKLKGSNSLSELKLRKKDVIKFFGSDSKMISSLIKKNKLNVKKEKDLVQLLKLYDHQ